MKNPRIKINDEIWSRARARAAGTNTTISTVVESALSTYLDQRGGGMTQGSVIPEFTSNTISSSADFQGTIEAPPHGVEVRKDPITGYREVRPVPKPGAKKRGPKAGGW